jgi:hypothetical protein
VAGAGAVFMSLAEILAPQDCRSGLPAARAPGRDREVAPTLKGGAPGGRALPTARGAMLYVTTELEKLSSFAGDSLAGESGPTPAATAFLRASDRSRTPDG